MKKHILMRFNFQFSITNRKKKIEMGAVGIVLTDHRSRMMETDSP